MTAWEIKGREFGNCNCDYGCPCQFNAVPTHGHCRGLAVFDSRPASTGRRGSTDCAPPESFAGPDPSTRAMARACTLLTGAPRPNAALLRILRGEDTDPGATVFQVFASTCDTLHEPIIADIDFELDSTAEPPRPHCRRGGDARRTDPQSCHRGRASCPHRATERLRVCRGRDRTRLVENARTRQLRARRQLWAIRSYSSLPKRAHRLNRYPGPLWNACSGMTAWCAC